MATLTITSAFGDAIKIGSRVDYIPATPPIVHTVTPDQPLDFQVSTFKAEVDIITAVHRAGWLYALLACVECDEPARDDHRTPEGTTERLCRRCHIRRHRTPE